MNKIKLISIQTIICILIFELISFLGFRGKLRVLYPYYFSNGNTEIPRGFYMNHPTHGVDISKNFKKTLVAIPKEIDNYFLWSNSLGCFDKKYDSSITHNYYFAGDSFTFGYIRNKNHFASILEKLLGEENLSCGVAGTGQQHQFRKFKDISKNIGYYPKNVIVNIFENDLEEDFKYPANKVINGHRIGSNVIKVQDNDKDRYYVYELTSDEINKSFNKWESERIRTVRKYDPRRFSSVAIISVRAIKKFLIMNPKIEFIDSPPIPIKIDEMNSYKIFNKYSEKNRESIKAWIKHANENSYNLFFTAIPRHETKEDNYYRDLKNFILLNNSTYWDFEKYLTINKINKDKLYLRHDGHFNKLGNKVYANFLYLHINSEKK